VGFPVARMVVLYQGKQTNETALFHTLHANPGPGDILLANRYFSSYWEIALAQQGGADVVCRLH